MPSPGFRLILFLPGDYFFLTTYMVEEYLRFYLFN